MTSVIFWDVMRRIVEIPYRRFGTTYRSNLQESRRPFFLDFLTVWLSRNYHHTLFNILEERRFLCTLLVEAPKDFSLVEYRQTLSKRVFVKGKLKLSIWRHSIRSFVSETVSKSLCDDLQRHLSVCCGGSCCLVQFGSPYEVLMFRRKQCLHFVP